MIDFIKLVRDAIAQSASDIHMSSGNRPAYRINGRIIQLDYPPITPEEIDYILQRCMRRQKYEEFKQTGDLDIAVDISGLGRFRMNAFKESHGSALAMRIIDSKMPDINKLGLPQSIQRILNMKDGLVLVTGPTGSGKSTTLAAFINSFNAKNHLNIITIEDPIEYVFNSKQCIINQREIGSDSISYSRALRSALREDPDIILVGEMRDLESISIALTAAETGHLVLSTLHTIGAATTIDRLVDVFPPAQQQQVRTQLSMALRSVISQHLLPTADGRGRVAAFEMMFVNNAISNLIREGKTANITQIIETGSNVGMITMENGIMQLLQRNIITKDVADQYITSDKMHSY